MNQDKQRIAELEEALSASLERESEAIRLAKLSMNQWREANERAAYCQRMAAEAVAIALRAVREPR